MKRLVCEEIEVEVLRPLWRQSNGMVLLVRAMEGPLPRYPMILYGQKRARPRIRTVRQWRVVEGAA